MNAMLHDIEAPIILGDTLSNIGKSMHDYDLVLTNPPFVTKKGGERATRDDFSYPTSNTLSGNTTAALAFPLFFKLR